MKKFFEKPTLKKILLVLAILFIIILAPITTPLMFLGGCFGIWRFTKQKPNALKRNIAILITIIGILGSYAVNKLTPNTIKEQAQVTTSTSTSFSSSSSSLQTNEASSSSTTTSSKKEKQEEEQKQKQEEERKARDEQAQKDAETRQIVEEANQAVKQLEDNQIMENIAPAQAAVERIVEPTTKANLTNRIELVQNAINQRAEEAQRAQEVQQVAENQETEEQATVSSNGYFKDYRGRWHRPNGQYASRREIVAAGLVW